MPAAAEEGRDGYDACAEALTLAACDDLADDVMLLKAEHLMQRGDLGAALRILQVPPALPVLNVMACLLALQCEQSRFRARRTRRCRG